MTFLSIKKYLTPVKFEKEYVKKKKNQFLSYSKEGMTILVDNGVVLVSLLLTLNIFTLCSSVFVVNFKQVNAGCHYVYLINLSYMNTFTEKPFLK